MSNVSRLSRDSFVNAWKFVDTYPKYHKRLSQSNLNRLLPKRISSLVLSKNGCALALKPKHSLGTSGTAWQRSQIRGSDPALLLFHSFCALLLWTPALPTGISLFSSQTLSVSLHRYLIDSSTLQLISSIMVNVKEVVAEASRLARNSSGRVPELNKAFSF